MIRYFSTFSGIGGFELGLQYAHERLHHDRDTPREHQAEGELHAEGTHLEGADRPGSNHELQSDAMVCVGFSEIDKYAAEIYQRHFPTHKNYGDITKINAEELPDFEVFVGGFPCQAFSVAGQRRGFEDTRGTLFFEIARIIRVKRPRYILLENVKGLLSHEGGRTYLTIKDTLAELGYDCERQTLNSKNHGVPQNRERVFIVGHLRGTGRPEVFPFYQDDGRSDSGESSVSGEVQTNGSGQSESNDHGEILQDGTERSVCVGTLRTHHDGRGFRESKSGLVPTIPARAREDGSGQPVVSYTLKARADSGIDEKHPQTLIIQKQGNNTKEERYVERKDVGAIKASNQSNPRSGGTSLVMEGLSIRRLTPTECERLQGFPDGWTEFGSRKCSSPTSCPPPFRRMCSGHDVEISDTQRYKTLGNAVTVNVIADICERLLR